MRIWAEVSTAAGSMLGIVDLASLSISRRLDAAGSLRLDMPASDPNANKHMLLGRYVDVYVKPDKFRDRQLVAQGILQQQRLTESGGARRLMWKATDRLEDLRRENTLRGLVYDDVSIESVVRDLVGKVSGWQVSVGSEVTGNTSQRFDGISILQALTMLAERHGYHFRKRVDSLRVEFGSFGVDAGLRVTDVRRAMNELKHNTAVAIVERLRMVSDGYQIINWIEPVSGPVDGALTLRRATTTTPYTVQSTTGPDGSIIYYLSDSASIATYGTIKAVVSPDELLVPIAVGTGMINAANILYDWAAAFLNRHKQPMASYRVSAVKVDKPVNPGAKVRLAYRGEAHQDKKLVRYVDVDADFWVMEVQEKWELRGHSVGLTLSNVDMLPPSAPDMVAAMMQSQKISQKGVTMSTDRTRKTDTITINPSSSASVAFAIGNSTADIVSAVLTMTRTNTILPGLVTPKLDGTALTNAPFLKSGVDLNAVVDFTDDLVAGTIQGDHTMVFESGYGSGNLDIEIEIVELILPGAKATLETSTLSKVEGE